MQFFDFGVLLLDFLGGLLDRLDELLFKLFKSEFVRNELIDLGLHFFNLSLGTGLEE